MDLFSFAFVCNIKLLLCVNFLKPGLTNNNLLLIVCNDKYNSLLKEVISSLFIQIKQSHSKIKSFECNCVSINQINCKYCSNNLEIKDNTIKMEKLVSILQDIQEVCEYIKNNDKNSNHNNKSVLVIHKVLQDKDTGTCYILE